MGRRRGESVEESDHQPRLAESVEQTSNPFLSGQFPSYQESHTQPLSCRQSLLPYTPQTLFGRYPFQQRVALNKEFGRFYSRNTGDKSKIFFPMVYRVVVLKLFHQDSSTPAVPKSTRSRFRRSRASTANRTFSSYNCLSFALVRR